MAPVVRGLIAVTSFCVAVAPAIGARLPTSAVDAGQVYEVYAVRYATLAGYPTKNLVAGADASRTTDAAAMIWLLKGQGDRRVLVDAGFYRQPLLDRWKPVDYLRPSDAVATLGVPPDRVTDIVVSHVHWDHLDGADLFPNATLWIQRAEYEFYVGADGRARHTTVTTDDAAMLHSRRTSGRVRLVDGDDVEILPGVRVYTGGRHTHASQYAAVATRRGTVVIASDNAYLYENLEKRVAIAQTLDAESNLKAQARMLALAASPALVVPGHDPAVLERFPLAGPRAVRID